MTYLTFIIDNYDNLPYTTVFLHGHDRSWHQPEHSIDILRAINLQTVIRDGYANVRCNQRHRCNEGHQYDLTNGTKDPSLGDEHLLPPFWEMIFPDGPPLPKKLGASEAAQFAVSRAAIHARPLAFWKAVRRPIERNLGDYKDKLPGAGWKDGYLMGVLYEHLWHVLFGKPAFYCPPEDYCQQTLLSDAIRCDRMSPDYWDPKGESAGWKDIKCSVDEDAMARAARAQDEPLKNIDV